MSKTPTARKGREADLQSEKLSGKKLVQARLPFKIIAAGSSIDGSPGATKDDKDSDTGKTEAGEVQEEPRRQDARKRRLSYDTTGTEEIGDVTALKKRSSSKENVVITAKKLKSTAECNSDVISLDEEDDAKPGSSSASPRTPKVAAESKRKKSSSSGAKEKKSEGTPKLQIKLPFSGGKNKRRKSMRQAASEVISSGEETELNPQKRKKLENTSEDNVKEVINLDSDTEDSTGKYDLKSNKVARKEGSSGNEESGATPSKEITLKLDKQEQPSTLTKEASSESEHYTKSEKTCSPSLGNGAEKKKSGEHLSDALHESKSPKVESQKAKLAKFAEVKDTSNVSLELEETVISSESSNESQQSGTNLEDTSAKSDSKPTSSARILSTENSTIKLAEKKNLTPKQIKLAEQRRKAREEKERKLQEERMLKQREKEEKEQAKKREREEKEEQRRKEREEKDGQKRKEREEKERKRLAEIEARNEEKRKRNEAKEEELRKKEEERKRKEQEKEDAELKKKKAAAAFTKFFVPKGARITLDAELDQDSREDTEGVAEKALAFRPFQIKGAMKLAPLCRKIFTSEARIELDSYLASEGVHKEDGDAPMKALPKSELYLSALKNRKISPVKWRRPSNDTKESNDDVMVVEDELEGAGQAIVEETHEPVEHLRAKYYKFQENRRPPYFGTWRKKSSAISARRPFAQDKQHFDYEVDSDLEWEEEEPGESLDGSDDDKDKESEDEDYEVDNEWFVPHGHLSDEELQNEDEAGDANTREAQKAKLQLLQQEFAQEMKKKTEKLKPRLVGCIWVDENGNQPALCPKIIWETLDLSAMLLTVPPLVVEPELPEKADPGSPSNNGAEKASEIKLKPIVLTEDNLRALIRLVHGNSHSKVFLIKEFIAYIEANEETVKSGNVRGPLKSVVREKIEDYAEWKATEVKERNNRKKNKKRLCWIVSDEVLQKMDLKDLSAHNSWQYTLQPKFVCAEKTQVSHTGEEAEAANTTKSAEPPEEVKTKRTLEITQFAKVLTSEEKKQLHKIKPETPKTAKSAEATAAKPMSPAVKKRVPLLMSVPRGQQISQPVKNSLLSNYLKGSGATKRTKASERSAAEDAVEVIDDDVVVLD